MAQDYRKISLSTKELVAAIDSYRRTVPSFLPGGEIVDYRHRSTCEILITVKMAYGKNVTTMDFEFKCIDFLPVLVKFCRENNVVLPEQGERFIECEDTGVSLTITSEV